ncbi:MAG: hexitol phosphatase HxpB [Flavobacteriales bacterium]
MTAKQGPNLKDFKAVIYDMDGVLIDSEPLWKIAMETVFGQYGSTLTKADFQKTVGLRIDEVIHFWNLHEGWNLTNEKVVEQEIIATLISLILAAPKELKGVSDSLHFFRKKGLKIGLATSSSELLIQTVLEALNLKHMFDFTYSAEHEPFGKPHPGVYLKVAQELGVKATQCLVIEDSWNGVLSGLAARMKVCCIPEKTHLPHPNLVVADYHFEDLNTLVQALC